MPIPDRVPRRLRRRSAPGPRPSPQLGALSLALFVVAGGCTDGDDDGTDDAANCDEPRCAGDGAGDGDGDGDGDGGLPGCVADRTCDLDFIGAEALAAEVEANAAGVLVDVRDPAQYVEGHIADARNLPQSELRADVDDVPGQVVALDAAVAAFGTAGLAPEDDVVLYGAANDTATARVAWTLQYFGHTGQIRLLDGGLTGWTDAGGAVSTAPGTGGSSYDGAVVDPLRVDRDWVLDHLDDANVVLIDARTDAEFAEGHIPGAISVDWQRNLSEMPGSAGLFLDDAQLSALYPPGDSQTTFVTYCQTGARASVSYAVLRKLGRIDVRIYDGSWAEWGSDPDTPKE